MVGNEGGGRYWTRTSDPQFIELRACAPERATNGPGEGARFRLSRGLPHSTAPDGAKAPAATDSRALADALLATAQEATEPAAMRALVDAASALLGGTSRE